MLLILRLKLFDAAVTPTMPYASETSTLTQKRHANIRMAQRRMLRQLTAAHKSYGDYSDYEKAYRKAQNNANGVRPASGVVAPRLRTSKVFTESTAGGDGQQPRLPTNR